jgi:hypothetical protein
MPRRNLLVLFPTFLSLACSSSSGGAAPDAGPTFDGSGPTFDGSRSTGDAASDSGRMTDGSGPVADGGTPDGSSDGATLAVGAFAVNEDTLTGSASDVYSSGAFFDYEANDPCSPFPTTLPKGCTYNACYSGPKVVKYLSAGTVTVSGGTPTMTMTPGSNGTYSFAQQTGELAGTGMLTLSATGGDVPAFTVSFPQITYASLTAPSQSQTLPRSQDMTVTWTGGTAGTSVYFRLLNNQQEIQCVFDAAAGTATVPSAILQKMPSAEAGYTFTAFTQASVTAGTVPVGVWSYHADIMAEDGRLTLQ